MHQTAGTLFPPGEREAHGLGTYQFYRMADGRQREGVSLEKRKRDLELPRIRNQNKMRRLPAQGVQR